MVALARLPTPETRDALRARLEAAVEAAIAALDAFDGDPDYEDQCEDEGGECNDEGWDSDSEPDDQHIVATYADDGHGGQNQLRFAHEPACVTIAERGC